MYNDFGCSPLLFNFLFFGNQSVSAGAVGNDGGSSPLVAYCTFTRNVAQEEGAALYQGTGPANNPVVVASIFWDNDCQHGPADIYNWHDNDPRVTGLIHHARHEHGGGFCEGTIRWLGHAGAIHPYMSAYTTMASLVRGEHEQVVEDYYWYLLHSTAAHAFPEGIFYQSRVAWSDTIPHATGASNFAFLLRHALIHERGGELHLLSGVPDWWLEPDRAIRVIDAPTHFGRLRLEVRGTPAGVSVKFDPPRRSPPRRMVLHLPGSRPLLKPVPGVEVALRPADLRRWDWPAVVEFYRR